MLHLYIYITITYYYYIIIQLIQKTGFYHLPGTDSGPSESLLSAGDLVIRGLFGATGGLAPNKHGLSMSFPRVAYHPRVVESKQMQKKNMYKMEPTNPNANTFEKLHMSK